MNKLPGLFDRKNVESLKSWRDRYVENRAKELGIIAPAKPITIIAQEFDTQRYEQEAWWFELPACGRNSMLLKRQAG
jgi:hypothetical protein